MALMRQGTIDEVHQGTAYLQWYWPTLIPMLHSYALSVCRDPLSSDRAEDLLASCWPGSPAPVKGDRISELRQMYFLSASYSMVLITSIPCPH